MSLNTRRRTWMSTNRCRNTRICCTTPLIVAPAVWSVLISRVLASLLRLSPTLLIDQTNSNTCEIAFCSSLSAGSLIKALNKLSSLEELELTLCSTSREQNANIIRHCSLLKTFKLNQQVSLDPRFAYDGEAVAIADTVHELRHLQLFGNRMTKEGLKAILDNCPHLQSLDLRACFRVDLAGDVGKRCAQQIKNFGHPYDSTDDCDFIVTDYDSHFDETNCDYDFDETSADEYDGMDLSDVEYYEFSDDGTFSSESSSDSMSS